MIGLLMKNLIFYYSLYLVQLSLELINKTLILEKITNDGLYLKHLLFELKNCTRSCKA
jgi:hypothetical protein